MAVFLGGVRVDGLRSIDVEHADALFFAHIQDVHGVSVDYLEYLVLSGHGRDGEQEE